MIQNLNLDIEYGNQYVIVRFNGEIDISNAAELKETLYNEVDKNRDKDVKLDFTDLNYIDSTGLGILVGILKRVKDANKEIYIFNIKNNVKKLFVITGLDKVFKIEE